MIYPLNDWRHGPESTGGRQGRFELLGLAAKALPLAPASAESRASMISFSGMGKLSTWVASWRRPRRLGNAWNNNYTVIIKIEKVIIMVQKYFAAFFSIWQQQSWSPEDQRRGEATASARSHSEPVPWNAMEPVWQCSSDHSHHIIELDDGKIYRKPLYLMVKTMVSCRFSLKPIHWS